MGFRVAQAHKTFAFHGCLGENIVISASQVIIAGVSGARNRHDHHVAVRVVVIGSVGGNLHVLADVGADDPLHDVVGLHGAAGKYPARAVVFRFGGGSRALPGLDQHVSVIGGDRGAVHDVDVVFLVDLVLTLHRVVVHADGEAAGLHLGGRIARVRGEQVHVAIGGLDVGILADGDQRVIPGFGGQASLGNGRQNTVLCPFFNRGFGFAVVQRGQIDFLRFQRGARADHHSHGFFLVLGAHAALRVGGCPADGRPSAGFIARGDGFGVGSRLDIGVSGDRRGHALQHRGDALARMGGSVQVTHRNDAESLCAVAAGRGAALLALRHTGVNVQCVRLQDVLFRVVEVDLNLSGLLVFDPDFALLGLQQVVITVVALDSIDIPGSFVGERNVMFREVITAFFIPFFFAEGRIK